VLLGLTEHQVRLQFQEEEKAEAKKGIPARHKVSASTFMAECLDVEEEQCVGRRSFGCMTADNGK
jgi:hypothetical protein